MANGSEYKALVEWFNTVVRKHIETNNSRDDEPWLVKIREQMEQSRLSGR